MNAISDLSAQAIAFITAVQTTLLNGEIDHTKDTERVSVLSISPGRLKERLESLLFDKAHFSADRDLKNSFTKRAEELVWISNKSLDTNAAINYTIKISVQLSGWIIANEQNGIGLLREKSGIYPTPYNWRLVIEKILYENADQRTSLAFVLQYLPIQVILALGGTAYDAHKQRILQMWNVDEEDRKALLSAEELLFSERFENLEKSSKTSVKLLLENLPVLNTQLIEHGAPLTFGTIFSDELQEIQRNRNRRKEEEIITGIRRHKDITEDTPVENKDPFTMANQMGICALAISGGGIRSATFNLGILQGLAEKKLLGKIDYLSTVSGGGYIGSWLAAWIKRDQSVMKVSNRLSPEKSPDPAGEELNPIKWLRMFSNYFAPNASIMSVDSWTFAITWLRNTLLNQVIIFLSFLAVLFAGSLLYQLWAGLLIHPLRISAQDVAAWSALLILPGALLAGAGMYAYDRQTYREVNIRRKYSKIIAGCIIAIAISCSYFISAWLASQFITHGIFPKSVYGRIIIFMPAALVGFAGLMLVGIMGRYTACIQEFQRSRFAAFAILFLVTMIAAALGLVCLAVISSLLGKMPVTYIGSVSIDNKVLQFIFGVPLTLEVLSLTVIVRMALLGKYFPDERREWWGRIGAYIHRTSFLWILVSAATLLGADLLDFAFNTWGNASIAATGGWVALVGSSVKAAFSAKTSGKGDEKGAYPAFLNILGKAGPYLFALGLLILLPGLIHPLLNLEIGILMDLGIPVPGIEILHLAIIIICASAAYFLAIQMGVNEFSMYNFYRNRLVRAYLGGTRRRTERRQTANPFTGFDMLDDEMLYKLTNQHGYYGPYPILNVALNASQGQGLDRHDRKAESFIFSPLYCGFDFSMAKSSYDKEKSYDYAYRQTKEYAFKGGPTIGTAMTISGAAVNPNQGYHSSPATAFLLTIFNAQMGRWIGNPRKGCWKDSNPTAGLGYIISNLVNKTSTRNKFVALSDGGHFDNMGLYELIRRKCPYIILCDAEQDGAFTCEGLANAIRRCRIDFGAEIKIDVSKITNRLDGRYSETHFALGEINYVGENFTGALLYIKSSIDGKEPVDVHEYALKNKTFPHQTTADQFFDEEQFESYRKLGLHIAHVALSDKKVINAFKFDHKAEIADEDYEAGEIPYQTLFNSIKNFFVEKKK